MPTLQSEVDIAAPPQLIWSVLTDFDSYAEWHPAIVGVVLYGPLLENTKGTLSIRVRPSASPSRFDMMLCEVEPGKALSWKGSAGAGWLARGFHFHYLHSLTVGTTRLVHGEKFEGLVPRLLWPLLKTRVSDEYDQFNRILRQRCEALHGLS